MATFEASRWRPLPVQPARSAMRSITSHPTLWRVPAYCEPGFPRPTTTFNEDLRRQHDRARSRSGRARIDGSSHAFLRPSALDKRAARRLSRPREELILEGAHGGFLCGFGVVPAADVERAVGREEAQLVGCGAAGVAGLAASARLGLFDGTLDRDHDVAQVLPSTGRQWEIWARHPTRWNGPADGLGRKGVGREERER